MTRPHPSFPNRSGVSVNASWPGSAGYLFCGTCHRALDRPGLSYCSLSCAAKGADLIKERRALDRLAADIKETRP